MKREASIIAAAAKSVRELWGLSTKEIREINLERSRERKMLANGTTRERNMLPSGSVILNIPPSPGKVLIGSGERRFQRKLWRAQRDPAAADWLSGMAEQFAIFDAMFPSGARKCTVRTPRADCARRRAGTRGTPKARPRPSFGLVYVLS